MRARIAGLLLLAGCASAPGAPLPAHAGKPAVPPASASPAPSVPQAGAPVLVVVIVDQLASWVFEQRRAGFAPNGAFDQLLQRGAYAPVLRYEHATTSTAPGHAALFTGLPPRESGVFANERLDDRDKPGSIFADSRTKVVVDRARDGTSSSAVALRAPTLADALHAQRPDAKIIALSLKDRAVVPDGGKSPTLAVWFEPEREAFVTSTAFAEALPGWLPEQNRALARALGGSWRPLDERWLEQHAATADEQAGEGDFGPAVRFPYELSQAKPRAKAFRGYPAADRAVLELARAALRALPEKDGEQPLLVVLSFSALDYVGHAHGPDSWESWEVLRELDLELGAFFDELEQRFGERLSILLSADHGTAPLPETAGDARARPWCAALPDPFERPCTKGERLSRADLDERLQRAADAALGPGKWIRGVVEPFAYFTPEAAALPPERRAALEQAAISALEQHPGVARVFASRSFAAACPPPADESLEALVCRSIPPGAGDLYIVSKPGSFFDPNLIVGRGINHGSPYLYDRTVPVLLRAARTKRPGARIDGRLRPADFTATAAALLHITPPAGAIRGRNLAAE